jgi:hypothetical protein
MRKDITGYYVPAVFKALFDCAQYAKSAHEYTGKDPITFFKLQAAVSMSLEKMKKYLEENGCDIDYLNGKKFGTSLDGNTIDLYVYVREHGEEAVDKAFAILDAAPRPDMVHLKGYRS